MSVSNVLFYIKRPIRFHLVPLVLTLHIAPLLRTATTNSLSLSSSIAVPSLLFPTPSLALPSLYRRGTTFLPSIGTFRLALALPSSGPRGALRCSASQSGRGVATSRERVCFPRAGPTWWRLWENSHAADYAARRRRRCRRRRR